MSSPEAEELASLVRSARAWLEVHSDAGTFGLPVASAPGSSVEVAAPARADMPAPPREHVVAASLPDMTPSAATPDERRRTLSVLAADVVGCTRCVLHEARNKTVFARGNPDAELCFVGEGPGADEDAEGLPFVGKAGQLLDRMIAAMGYAVDDVYICNVVKCRPPGNRKPEPDEMTACLPYLHEQLATVSPKVIVALGATAAHGLFGAPTSITRARGQWKLYRSKIPVMPTFHPAYLLRQPEAKREVWQDLQAVMERLGKKRG